MQQLFEDAEKNFSEGQKKEASGNVRLSCDLYQKSIDDLRALRPSKARDSLLARVYLARYQASKNFRGPLAEKDLRYGYSYAKTSKVPEIQTLAEELWQQFLAAKD